MLCSWLEINLWFYHRSHEKKFHPLCIDLLVVVCLFCFVFCFCGGGMGGGGWRKAECTEAKNKMKWNIREIKSRTALPPKARAGTVERTMAWVVFWVCLALLSCKKQRAHSRASPSTCRSSPWDGGQPPAYAFLSFQVSDFRFLSGHLVDWSSNSKALYVNLPLGRKEVPSTNVINLDFWDSRVSALKK